MDPVVPHFSQERFFLERVAARYGLSCVVHEDRGTVEERDVHGTWSMRDATSAEVDMWRALVPELVRSMVDRAWTGGLLVLPATAEEVYSSCLRNEWTYLNGEDFCSLRELPSFHPSLNRAVLMDCVMGTVHGRWRVVASRAVPRGTCFPSDARVPALHPFRSPSLRFDPGALLGIELQPLLLRPMSAVGLASMRSPAAESA